MILLALCFRWNSCITINTISKTLLTVSLQEVCMFSLYFSIYSRITCLGCENGHVRCSIVDCDNNCVIKNLYVEYENPVSNVQLFTLSLPSIPLEQFLNTEGKFINSWIEFMNHR